MNIGNGFIDVAVFLGGATVLVALARVWIRELQRSTAAGYVAFTLLLFAPVLATSCNQVPLDYVYRFPPWEGTLEETVQPSNPVLADVVLQILPFRHLVRERLLDGNVPLWSHELGTGQPLLANAQSAPFAPLHLMALPLPALRAMTVAAAWQVLVALLGTHLLLRQLGATSRGAALAAVAFSLSTFSFVWLYYPLGMATSWIPAVLLGIVCVLQNSPRAWLGLGLTAAALALSGHPTVIVHTAVVGVVVFAIGLGFRASGSSATALRKLGLAVMLAMACAAPAILPVLEALPHGSRAVQVKRLADATRPRDADGTRAPEQAEHDCRPRMLLQPYACGSPRDGNWVGPAHYSGAAAYGGWIILALGLVGGLLFRGLPRLSLLLGLACLGIAQYPQSVAFLVGDASPFAGMLHGRARGFWILGLAVAAGLSLERVISRRFGRWALVTLLVCGAVLTRTLAPESETAWQVGWRWTVGLGLLAATVPIAVPRWQRSWPLLALSVLFVDLLLAGVRYNPLVPAELDLSPPDVVRFLGAQEPAPFRVHAVGWRFSPYLPAVYGLWDARGFDPMRPGEAERLMRLRMSDEELGAQFLQKPAIDTPFLSFLGVRYLLADRRPPPPSPWRLVYEGVGGTVWENPDARSIFFVPGEALPVSTREKALEHAANSPQIAERVLVEGITEARRGQRGRVRSIAARDNRLRVALSGPPGTVYASSVTWMPGWRYDRDTVRLVRVDGAFLGLVKTARGDVVAELRYHPAGWRVGLSVSVVLALLLTVGRLVQRSRRGNPPGGPSPPLPVAGLATEPRRAKPVAQSRLAIR